LRTPCLWFLLAVALLPPGVLPAEQPEAAALALTVSTNTFLPLGRWPEYPVPPGLYARVGLGWLPGSHLEFELFQVPRLVPDPYSEAFTGFSAGAWLLKRKRNSYFNLTADVAFLYGLEGRMLLAARLCPIVLGGPYYHYADRLLAVGLLWDPDRGRVFLQLQLVGLSLFF
jgi:hypothetical protein